MWLTDNNKKVITISAIIVLSIIIFNLVNFNYVKNRKIEKYKNIIKQNELLKDSILIDLELKEKELKLLQDSFKIYQAELDGVIVEKEKIKIEYVKETNNVGNFTILQIDSFFSSRYN